jgi:hypothetical protein
MCGFEERFAAMNNLTGGWKMVEGNPELRLPSPYPYGGPWVVKDVKISPIGEVFGSPPYVYLDVSFGFPKNGEKQQEDEEQAEPIDLYTVSANVSAEALKIPYKKITYSDGDTGSGYTGYETTLTEDDAEYFVYLPQIELSVSSDKCRGMNLAVAKSLVGKVNNAPFRVRDGGGMATWAPECVLYMGLSGNTSYTTEGFAKATQDHKFLCKDHSWNTHYDAKTGSWKRVQTVDGQSLYTAGNLMSLFG